MKKSEFKRCVDEETGEDKPCYLIDEKRSVCILPSKDFGKRDIIIISENGARSVRSITEMANKLIKEYKVPQERVVGEIFPWASRRLRDLEMEETSTSFKLADFGVKRDKKQKV